MKFKEIKSETIIHCKSNNEAMELLGELKKQGYPGTGWVKEKIKTAGAYIVASKEYGVGITNSDHFGHSYMASIEFTDLIEPESTSLGWITSSDAPDTFTCPVCGHSFDFWKHEQKAFLFCPHCGTDMRKQGDTTAHEQEEPKQIETYTMDCCRIYRHEDNKQIMCWLEDSDKHEDPWEWADEKYKWFCRNHEGKPEDFYYAEVSRRIYRKGGTA